MTAQVEPGFLVKALPLAAPEKGEQIDSITKDFQGEFLILVFRLRRWRLIGTNLSSTDLILPGITHWQHPSFFGYVSDFSVPKLIFWTMSSQSESSFLPQLLSLAF